MGRVMCSRVGGAVALLAGGALLLVPAGTGAQSGTVQVKAEGNPFTGGLRFNPAAVTTQVGQTVRWTNTDSGVPHTATENHRLWDLTGTYGLGQESNTGFGPGESRERVFEAGTHDYFCKVHPEQMRGTVSVPVRVARGRRGRRFRRVTVTWAAAAPAGGLAFDVQRRRGRGRFRTWRSGTTSPRARMRVRRGRRWQFRARLRKADDPSAATGWSPPVGVRG